MRIQINHKVTKSTKAGLAEQLTRLSLCELCVFVVKLALASQEDINRVAN